MIQQREGRSLQEILNTRGSEYFAQVESSVLQNLESENSIISTGGSAIYYEDAMMHLKENGTVMYLRISLDVMLSRIRNITTRGILLHDGETILDMYASREPLYRKYADIIIDCDELTVEEAVTAVCASVQDQEQNLK